MGKLTDILNGDGSNPCPEPGIPRAAIERRRRRKTENLTDWRTITDDREKYQAYLCSREWAEKREAVRKRAGDKCERCKVLPMAACHHLTYERKYREELTDLQAICQACHDFTHGKSGVDPSIDTGIIGYLKSCRRRGMRPFPVELVWVGDDEANSHIRTALFVMRVLRLASPPFEQSDWTAAQIEFFIERLLGFSVPGQRQIYQWEFLETPQAYVTACEIFGLETGLREDERFSSDSVDDEE